MTNDLTQYASLLGEIKTRIGQAQTKAAFSANREMLALYWDIGRLITQRQMTEGWGTAVIPRLSRDLRKELPGLKGFSERNMDLMLRFYREYPNLLTEQPQELIDGGATAQKRISQQPVAKLQNIDNKHLIHVHPSGPPPVAQLNRDTVNNEGESQTASSPHEIDKFAQLVQPLVAQLPWTHNTILIQSVKELKARLWYMQQTIEQGWSRSILQQMIKSKAHLRQAKAFTNFEASLPAPQSDLAQHALKDPYIFDFLTLDTSFRERELEAGLLRYLERFLLELGKGFSFVGRQFPLSVGEDDFYIDLLFYHL